MPLLPPRRRQLRIAADCFCSSRKAELIDFFDIVIGEPCANCAAEVNADMILSGPIFLISSISKQEFLEQILDKGDEWGGLPIELCGDPHS